MPPHCFRINFFANQNNVFAAYSVGRPKHERVMFTANEQDRYIGQ